MKTNVSYIIIALFAIVFSANSFAVSLVYAGGFECTDDPLLNNNSPDANNTGVQLVSEFKVKQDLGGGLYIFELLGGLPRIIRNHTEVCIESEAAIGYSDTNGTSRENQSGVTTSAIPARDFYTEAMAFFDGKQLVININAIHTSASPSVGIRGQEVTGVGLSGIISGSTIKPNSFTLILEFNPDNASFKLKQYMRNTGSIRVSSAQDACHDRDCAHHDPDLYIESITPRESRAMATPIPDIEYLVIE